MYEQCKLQNAKTQMQQKLLQKKMLQSQKNRQKQHTNNKINAKEKEN